MANIGIETSLVGFAAIVASTLAGVTGFGGAAVLLPVLVFAFGTRDAIPILTVAQLVGNASRVWFNRREVDLRVVGWFALGGVPFALLAGEPRWISASIAFARFACSDGASRQTVQRRPSPVVGRWLRNETRAGRAS